MQALLITAAIAFILSGLMLILKSLEKAYGLPQFVVNFRDKTDRGIWKSFVISGNYIYHRIIETRQAISRTPHLLIHLFYVLKDKFRDRFAHYIAEVKGQKPIKDNMVSSDYLKAVKSYKEEQIKDL